MTLVELHDRLLAWAGAEERQPWLLAARGAWFGRVGEPHEEDQSYELRMNGLLDHYLYDFRPDGTDRTIDLFHRDGAPDLTTDERAQVRDLGRSRRPLFDDRRIRPGVVEVEEVLGELKVSQRCFALRSCQEMIGVKGFPLLRSHRRNEDR